MPTRYTDQTLNCCDCPNTFIFSAAEQARFANAVDEDGKKFAPPKRCLSCRAEARRKREQKEARGARQQAKPHRRGSVSNDGPIIQYRSRAIDRGTRDEGRDQDAKKDSGRDRHGSWQRFG